MSKSPRAKAIRNTLTERIAIRDVLANVLIGHDDGTVSYKPSHSDHTVAAGMGFPCTHNGVEGVRRELFGKLRPSVAPKSLIDNERIARLESIVRTLCLSLGIDVENL